MVARPEVACVGVAWSFLVPTQQERLVVVLLLVTTTSNRGTQSEASDTSLALEMAMVCTHTQTVYTRYVHACKREGDSTSSYPWRTQSHTG